MNADRKFDAICIFGTMRSGSNLLERIMTQNPEIIGFGEVFNPHFISRRKTKNFHGVSLEERNQNPKILIEKLDEISASRLPLFRYFPTHLPVGFDEIVDDPRIAKIFLKRNPLDSFISLEIARTTERWLQGRSAETLPPASVEFDSTEFENWEMTSAIFYENLEERLKDTGQAYFLVEYENIKNYGMLDLLGEFLGLGCAWTQYIEPIARQNPMPREEYLKNPEILQQINLPDWKPLKFDNRKPDPIVARAFWAKSLNLIHVPIYGNGLDAEMAALRAAEGDEVTPVFTKDVANILAENPDVTAYTRVVHPIDRIYTILMRQLLQEENGFDQHFLEILKNEVGVELDRLPAENSAEAFANIGIRKAADMKPILRKFIVAVRKELWNGFRKHLLSNQFWPQYQQVQNLRENFALDVIGGEEFPDRAPFEALRSQSPIVDPYLLAPFDVRKSFRKFFAPQIAALYQEDFDEYGFEIENA